LPPIAKRLAVSVKGIRTERRQTQQALTDKAKIRRVYLIMIERGTRAPSLEILDRLANALKVTAGKLVQ